MRGFRSDFPKGSGRAFVLSAIFGGTFGTIAGFCAWVWLDPSFKGAWWGPLGMVLLFDVLACLACAAGLLALGLVSSIAVFRWYQSRWFVVLETLLGGVGGGLVASLVYTTLDWRVLAIGVVYGAATGFWWGFFYRRVLLREAALNEAP